MHLSRSSSRIVIVTLDIRIMANLPDRKGGQRRVDHGGQSGHFYLAESGHFYLGITLTLRIMYIMLNTGIPSRTMSSRSKFASKMISLLSVLSRTYAILLSKLNQVADSIFFATSVRSHR